MTTTGTQLRPIDLRARAEIQADARSARQDRTRAKWDAAVEWARSVGFSERLVPFAASDALLLKAFLPERQITKEGVMERWRTRRPYLLTEGGE